MRVADALDSADHNSGGQVPHDCAVPQRPASVFSLRTSVTRPSSVTATMTAAVHLIAVKHLVVIGRLTCGEGRGGKRIAPAEAIPVVNVFAQSEHVEVRH